VKAAALLPVLLVLSAAPVAAAGLNLGWFDCGGTPATLNRTFACNTNTGIDVLLSSFVAPCCITGMSANEIVLDVQTAGAALPPWWTIGTGRCRSGSSLIGNYDFTAGPFTCLDYWQAGAIGALSAQTPAGNRFRIKGVFALPEGDPRIVPIPQGVEVYSFKVNLNHARTVGLGACAGCSTGACIVLNSIKLNQAPPAASPVVSSPAVRSFATWQGGIGGDCFLATPAKNTTWGSIKAQYR
jgi:hypothetical protein